MRKYKASERNGKKVIKAESQDNIFKQLGRPEAEAVNLLARADLMIAIRRVIAQRNWTQYEAAKELGVTQPRVSALMTGKIEKFTVDMLMKWLDKLGKEVKITVKSKKLAA